ncbi:hypothetical protein RIF29_19924 [Crotalaria pallida]|uniref:Uncharacterized protein n=1 Tax=Crotalaria pallida TaxID=3830 RepID=A0AAN9F094_CROPI
MMNLEEEGEADIWELDDLQEDFEIWEPEEEEVKEEGPVEWEFDPEEAPAVGNHHPQHEPPSIPDPLQRHRISHPPLVAPKPLHTLDLLALSYPSDPTSRYPLE